LRAQKNLPLLIRAFARVTETVSARLLIVGSGREEESLRALIHELKLDERVALAGYRANPYAFLAKADLFASASLWEGMPNSLMEALALGVPVVATDCPSGPRELLAPQTRYDERLRAGSEDAEFGLLAAVDDEGALASSMQRLLEDDSLRAEYARKSLARAEAFAFPVILPQYARALGL
jgi:glycosyltransferase involved in cell wall biosynthesis